jgi:transposase
MPSHTPMPNDAAHVEIMTGRERRRRYTANEKLSLVEATLQPGMTVSAAARLHGVSPSLLFKWRQLMSHGGQVAVKADEDVIAASKARELEQRVRELERLLGRNISATLDRFQGGKMREHDCGPDALQDACCHRR